MKKKSNRKGWILLLLVAAIAGAAYHYWPQPVTQKVFDASAVMTVTTVSPLDKTIDQNIHASGVVTAREDVVVTTELTGVRITEVLADEGSWVKQGQPLARLDTSALKNQLAQRDAEFAQAERNFRRTEAVKKSGAISASDVDSKRAAYESAKAQHDTATLDLKRATLVAPTSGLVFARAAHIGALIGSNDPLFHIAQDGKVELEADIAEDDLSALSVGQSVNISVSGGKSVVEGKIRLISPHVDDATRTAKLRIAFTKSVPIPIGTFAEAAIATRAVHGLMIPQTALVLDNGQPLVWTVDAQSNVHPLPVKPSYRADGMVMVSGEGLSPATNIIAKAGPFLRDGDHVALSAPADTGTTSAAPSATAPAAAPTPESTR